MKKTLYRDIQPALKDVYETKWKGQPIEGSLYKITYKGKYYYRFKAGKYDPYKWDLVLKEAMEPK